MGFDDALITEGKIIIQRTWFYRNSKNEYLDQRELLPAEIMDELESWLEKLPRVLEISHMKYLFNESRAPLSSEELFLHFL